MSETEKGETLPEDVGAGYLMDLTKAESNMEVTVYRFDAEDEPVYETELDRTFYRSEQKTRTFAGTVADAIPDSDDAEKVKQGIIAACSRHRVQKNESDDLSEAGARALEAKDGPTVIRPQGDEDATYTITMAYEDEEADFTFTLAEWTGSGGAQRLREQFTRAFDTPPSFMAVEKEDWRTLVDTWMENVKKREGDATSPVLSLGEAALDELRDRPDLVNENPSALGRPQASAYYEPDPPESRGLDADGAVVWVQANAFAKAIREAGGTLQDQSEVVNALADDGVFYASNKRQPRFDGEKHGYAYPVDPEVFGWARDPTEEGASADTDTDADGSQAADQSPSGLEVSDL